jgi:hypothetical protein
MNRFLAASLSLNLILALSMVLHWPLAGAAGRGGGGPTRNGDVNGDGGIDISDPIYLLAHLFQGGPEPARIECSEPPLPCPPVVGLPATGQKACYDSSGAEVECGHERYPGQDGEYLAGCPIEDRFRAVGDGTVEDRCTGLVWQQETAPDFYSWEQALQYCDILKLGGEDDWRLPNVLELLSIQDYSRVGPSHDPVFGPLGSLGWYWTSSTAQDLPSFAWIVSFGVGLAKGWPKPDAYHVRAVRGGL